MAKSYEVLNYLLPNGGWIQRGEEFEGIEFIEAEPITKQEYEAAFAIVDKINSEKKALDNARRENILDRLGITKDEAKLLLS